MITRGMKQLIRKGVKRPHISGMTRGEGGRIVSGSVGNQAAVSLLRKAKKLKRGSNFRKSVAGVVRAARNR